MSERLLQCPMSLPTCLPTFESLTRLSSVSILPHYFLPLAEATPSRVTLRRDFSFSSNRISIFNLVTSDWKEDGSKEP